MCAGNASECNYVMLFELTSIYNINDVMTLYFPLIMCLLSSALIFQKENISCIWVNQYILGITTVILVGMCLKIDRIKGFGGNI